MEELLGPGEKIGEFLLRIGAITPKQLALIMIKQQKDPERMFGEIAIEFGYIDDKAIKKYLDAKRKDNNL